MEFPFGHHHPHHRRDEEEEEEERRRAYPPPGHQPHMPDPYITRGEGYGYERPGFPPVQHVSHEVDQGFGAPRPYPSERPGFPPVQHVSHEVDQGFGAPRPFPASGYGREEEGRYGHEPHHGHHNASITHVSHESYYEGGGPSGKPTVRIFSKADADYSLSVRDGAVILARANPRDEYQHWIKDERFSTKVKDEEGFPSFALVNKVTGQALKHSIGATHPVRLIPYKPDYLDESVLWTESKDLGDGFRCIRMVNNIRLNFDAFHGDEDHGGVHEGTTVVLWEWLKGKNQRWKIVPY